ncbi:MAG: DivIVA domain-containing protein [Erysipelotrichia bacterium]|nr:DivIVA domain-containing protein [Erysipelotrichia bacterium]
MERNINLDIDTILNKEFNIEFKGFSPIEVDSFLDQVVQDYDTYQKMIADLNEQVAMYQNATDKLKARVIELENKINMMEKNNAENESTPAVNNLSQVDILRRIARLEQEVFNRK